MTNTPSKIKSFFPYLVLAIVCIAVGVFAGVRTKPGTLNYESIQAALVSSTILPIDFKTVPAFSLLQNTDDVIQEAAFEGRWNVLIFGFTHCPDVCPIALSTMKGVVSELQKSAMEPPQVAFITVDPNRDTPERLSEYVAHFNDSFVPISGNLADITSLIGELGIVASYTANNDDPTEYTVDHSTSMLLVDPELRVRAKFDIPHTVADVLADYKTLLEAFNQD